VLSLFSRLRNERASQPPASKAKSLFYGEITDPFHCSTRLMQDAAERLIDGHASACEQQQRNLVRELTIACKLAGSPLAPDEACLANAPASESIPPDLSCGL
jgi:hypothetical protein